MRHRVRLRLRGSVSLRVRHTLPVDLERVQREVAQVSHVVRERCQLPDILNGVPVLLAAHIPHEGVRAAQATYAPIEVGHCLEQAQAHGKASGLLLLLTQSVTRFEEPLPKIAASRAVGDRVLRPQRVVESLEDECRQVPAQHGGLNVVGKHRHVSQQASRQRCPGAGSYWIDLILAVAACNHKANTFRSSHRLRREKRSEVRNRPSMRFRDQMRD